jgi:hypothetical protein
MFRALAERVSPPPPTGPPAVTDADADAVLSVYPLQLSRFLDEVWAAGGFAGTTWSTLLNVPSTMSPIPTGSTAKSQEPAGLLATLASGVKPTPGALTQPFTVPATPGTTAAQAILGPAPLWDHLMYGYLIEATGIVEIFADVVRRYVVGETLPTPSADALAWVRSTEELFFRDPPLFSTSGALTSQLRPDAAINRRNVYWRMFGMDLPHPVGRGINGQPWKRDVGPTINTRFLELWNELLRQVWLGYENDTNSSGAKATDPSYVAYLCQTLSELLKLRRQGGMLAREEFAFVSMMSWFHLTVEHDTSIVIDLKSTAGAQGNAADRLAAIGARVGIAPSRQSRELFELADLISPVLWAIELGFFNSSGQAETLYKHGTPNAVSTTLNRIVDLWQSATGERVKDLAVTTRRAGSEPRSAQPTRLMAGTPLSPPKTLGPAARPSTNGHRPTTLTRT